MKIGKGSASDAVLIEQSKLRTRTFAVFALKVNCILRQQVRPDEYKWEHDKMP